MNNFNITPIEDVLANQENLVGLLELLDNTLNNSLRLFPKNSESNFATIPEETINLIVYQLLRDKTSLVTLLNFLGKTIEEDKGNLTKAITNYYKTDAKRWN